MSEPKEKCKCHEATEATRMFFPEDALEWETDACYFLRSMMQYRFPKFNAGSGGCHCPKCGREICDSGRLPF